MCWRQVVPERGMVRVRWHTFSRPREVFRATLTGKHDTLVRRAHQMLNAALEVLALWWLTVPQVGLVTITRHASEIYVMFSVRVACVMTSEGSSEWEYDACDYFVMWNIRWSLASPVCFVGWTDKYGYQSQRQVRSYVSTVPSTSENKKQKRDSSH